MLLILVAGLAAALPILASVSANAQDQVIRRKWSLFDTFAPRRSPRFNEAERYTFPPPPRAARKNAVAKPRKSKSRVVAPQAPEEPKIAVVEKQPSARTILVIGDFLASGLAEGLDTAFAQNAGIRILDRSRGSSGIVRDDVFDWSKELAAIIEADKPAAIAIMIGSNDRQQMLVNGQRETLRSEAWTDAYEDRTEALAKAVADTKLPFVWVSMPAFKSAKMTSDMLAFNEIYKTSALASGGEYVDVWDGFVDETGAFVSTGPDVSGQSVRLRSGDGINMTSAGKTKLAFYTEKPLRKLLGLPSTDGPGPSLPALSLSPNAPVVPGAVDRTEPMALDDPNLDGATELLGASTAPASAAPVANVSAPPTGRADDFLRPPAAAAAAPDTASTAAR